MGASTILEFKDYAERDAHDILNEELGNKWRVVIDNTVYRANAVGVAAANWVAVGGTEVDLDFPLILGTVGQRLRRAPFNGKVLGIDTILDAIISVADEEITTKIGGVLITNGALTIAFTGAAIGTIDTATPTALNTFSEGDLLEVEFDGGSTATPAAMCTWHCERTG